MIYKAKYKKTLSTGARLYDIFFPAEKSSVRNEAYLPQKRPKQKQMMDGLSIEVKPGLFVYSGFGIGTYYSKIGFEISCNPSSARLMAEAEGVKYQYRDTFQFYKPTYLGD